MSLNSFGPLISLRLRTWRCSSRHFQERMPYGLFVPDVPDATAYTLDGSESV
jgi:hypothetical protein